MEEGRNWRIRRSCSELAEKLAQSLRISKITAQILINRGIKDYSSARKFLNGTIKDIDHPKLLSGIEGSVSTILDTIKTNKRIRVFGDYDADGVTSTVLLLRFLKKIGAQSDYYIPHRLEEGYGLSEKGIKKAFNDGISLIITTDCGISDFKEIELAKKLGIKTIITDHHEISSDLPLADFIINPKNPVCRYPFKNLSGVGVVFLLISAICDVKSLPIPEEYLDLVAIGSIADVVPMLDENRIFIKEGLKRISNSSNPWLNSIISKTARKMDIIDTWDVGFIIAPRINAAGRMDRADLAIELLLCDNQKDADALADELDELNKKRQKTETAIRREVVRLIEKNEDLLTHKAIILASEKWHPGVLGITASRISEKYGKPVFLIALSNGFGKGSARAGEGVNLFELMQKAKDLFLNFGGHTSAGGFSIPEKNIPLLKNTFERLLDFPLNNSQEPQYIDLELSPGEFTMKLADEMKLLEPFGEKNPAPLFILRGVKIVDHKTVGSNSHLRLILQHNEASFNGIAFKKGNLEELIRNNDLLYDLVLTPMIDNFEGTEKLCANIKDIQYPDKNSALVISNPYSIITCNECMPRTSKNYFVPMIINSRNVYSKIRYVKEISRFTSRGILFVRTPGQLKKIKALLSREGIDIPAFSVNNNDMTNKSDNGKNNLTLAFPKNSNDMKEADDIVFLFPPPSLLHFSQPLFKNTRRIHFLFSNNEIIFEENLQSVFEPTIEVFSAIQKTLAELLKKGVFIDCLEKLTEHMNNIQLKKITVEVAFKILAELGCIEKRGDYYYPVNFKSIDENTLVLSKSYNSLKNQRLSFGRFKELYVNSFDTLKGEILSIIGNS